MTSDSPVLLIFFNTKTKLLSLRLKTLNDLAHVQLSTFLLCFRFPYSTPPHTQAGLPTESSHSACIFVPSPDWLADTLCLLLSPVSPVWPYSAGKADVWILPSWCAHCISWRKLLQLEVNLRSDLMVCSMPVMCTWFSPSSHVTQISPTVWHRALNLTHTLKLI